VRAIIAESFERIHRSNLIGMGVLPLQFKSGESCFSLGLNGDEIFNILNLEENLTSNKEIKVIAVKSNVVNIEFSVNLRLDSSIEIHYYQNGGILQYVLRNILKNN
jgi:aconitate hydratase